MSTTIIESQGDVEFGRGQKMLVTKLDSAQLLLEQKQAEFAEYLKELKAREEEVAELKKKLFEEMDKEGVKKLESTHLTLTAVHPKPRHSIDTKKMQAMNPGLYKEIDEAYGKDTPVSGYVKITPKEKGE